MHRLHLPAPDIMLAEVQMVQPPCTSLHRPAPSCTAPALPALLLTPVFDGEVLGYLK